MKRTLVVLLTSAALSLPALAAQPGTAHMQQSNRSTMNWSRSQVRTLQRDLDRKGFKAGRADGILGPETRAALKSFQQKNGLNATGQPTSRTLAALGVTQSQTASTRHKYRRSAKANLGKSQNQPQPQNQPAPQNQPQQGSNQQ